MHAASIIADRKASVSAFEADETHALKINGLLGTLLPFIQYLYLDCLDCGAFG